MRLGYAGGSAGDGGALGKETNEDTRIYFGAAEYGEHMRGSAGRWVEDGYEDWQGYEG